jgi:hypothetical protein
MPLGVEQVRYRMHMQADDTDPRARAVQHRLLREAGPDRRSELAMRLSSTMIRTSRDALRRMHPELDDMGVNLLWAELHYGRDLAERVRHYIELQSR